MLGCSGMGWRTNSPAAADDPARLEYAGDLRYAWPGTGCLGLPAMLFSRSIDHRSCTGFRLKSVHLNTPAGVPTSVSMDRISNPRYTPESHWSSDFTGFSFVFGILNSITSPNSVIWALLLLPLIISRDVLPDGRTLYLVIKTAACRTIHGTTGCRSRTLC